MKYFKANLNDHIKFKLGAKTIKTMAASHSKDLGDYAAKYPFSPPATDSNGYCKMQLHEFMRIFGPYLDTGIRGHPFEDLNVFIEGEEA